MNTVVVIDAGGRGAALVQAYSKSPHVDKIIAIPGNDLMQINSEKPVETYPHLKTTDVKEILEVCHAERDLASQDRAEHVSLIDVAQDNAVEAGLTDALLKNGFKVFGPDKSAGELEWNKVFARNFMAENNISQPEFFVFDNVEKGIEFLSTQPDQPWFVKAAGLCEGKGVLPAKNNAEAEERIIELKKFGKASKTFLLEKWLKSNGQVAEEFSAFAVSDGKTFQIIGYAQDHKRLLDGDLGENTGGMGCVSPVLVVTDTIKMQTHAIFKKTFAGLKKIGREYKGVLYLGGIIINERVYVIEYNARWGDPEAQVIVEGIENDFYELALAVSKGSLDSIRLTTDRITRVSVAFCAKGYPFDYSNVKGKEVLGIKDVLKINGVSIYGAGISKIKEKYVVSGGRVLHVIGMGKNVIEARKKAYKAISLLNIEGDNFVVRHDIGYRDVARLKK